MVGHGTATRPRATAPKGAEIEDHKKHIAETYLDGLGITGSVDDAIDAYNQFLLICQENGDSVSAKIFETIIDDEQAHFNYFDSVNDHIKKLGDTYLAKIAGTSSSTGLTPKGFAVDEGGEKKLQAG